jgi:hypothetical protein
VDLIAIMTGNFYDKDRKKVLAWVRTCDSKGKVLHDTV